MALAEDSPSARPFSVVKLDRLLKSPLLTHLECSQTSPAPYLLRSYGADTMLRRRASRFLSVHSCIPVHLIFRKINVSATGQYKAKTTDYMPTELSMKHL